MAGATSLIKVLIPKAVVICVDIDLGKEAKQCLDSDPGPLEFLNALLERQLYVDAVRFLARALPKRESAWWACLCARSSLNDACSPEYIKALTAAETWVFKPDETNRRQANAAAKAAGFDNPAAWAAMAAFWSEGSMAPEDMPPVPAAENLSSKAVTGAVMLAAVQSQPEKSQEKYFFFIEQAIDIANGGNGKLWQN